VYCKLHALGLVAHDVDGDAGHGDHEDEDHQCEGRDRAVFAAHETAQDARPRRLRMARSLVVFLNRRILRS
jgi:hypothetical protein